MANFQTNFDNGEGTLLLDYTGTPGTSTVTPEADCNCGEDRTTNISVSVEGGEVSKNVTINQTGVREQFIPADEEEGMMGADGDYFLGIKDDIDEIPECCDYSLIIVHEEDVPNLSNLIQEAGGFDAKLRVKIMDDVSDGSMNELSNSNTSILKDCTNLWLDLGSVNHNYGWSGFGDVGFVRKLTTPKYSTINTSSFSDMTGLDEVIVPSGVEVIDSSAFSGSSLSKITLPDTLTIIRQTAFYGTVNLSHIEIPSSVEVLSSYAFANSGLESVIIGGNASMMIGDYCFSNCLNLTYLKYLGEMECSTISSVAFGNTGLSKVCVTEAYQGETFGGLPVEVY